MQPNVLPINFLLHFWLNIETIVQNFLEWQATKMIGVSIVACDVSSFVYCKAISISFIKQRWIIWVIKNSRLSKYYVLSKLANSEWHYVQLSYVTNDYIDMLMPNSRQRFLRTIQTHWFCWQTASVTVLRSLRLEPLMMSSSFLQNLLSNTGICMQ